MPDPATLTIVLLALLFAGTAKGIVGFGIQVAALPVLTIALDLLAAMAIMLLPTVASNVWQAAVGGYARELLRRLWLFLLAVPIAVYFGSLLLVRIELAWLTAVLGLVLITYATLALCGFRMSVARRHEIWLGPIFGAVKGLIMGMTGSSVVPGTMYLQSLKLPRDMLVQAMGMLYMVAAAALAVAMQIHGLLNLKLGAYSLLAVIPALLGMWLGQGIRRRLPEILFRRVFFSALLALGLYVLVTAV